MASSIYVYKNLKEYKDYYKGKDEQLVHQIPIIDMYIDAEHKKLFVVTNQDSPDDKNNIDFYRTIVHVRNEEWKPIIFRTDLCPELVQHDKLIFNGKSGWIEFFPHSLRKPRYAQHVDRFLGGVHDRKTYYMKYDYKYYDFLQDRINLILGEERISLFGKIRNLFRF